MNKGIPKKYKAIVMGASAGGLAALTATLPRLSDDFHLPVLIVQHMSPSADDFLAKHFNTLCDRPVREATDKEPIRDNHIYFAPANYHLLVEPDKTLALSITERVQYSRPSIDVLFETAAEAYLDDLAGVILTGANADGARGIQRIRQLQGLGIAQSPATAEADAMPRAAIEKAGVDHVLDLEDIAPFINRIGVEGI